MLYCCAGVEEEEKKERRPLNNLEREMELLVKECVMAYLRIKHAHYLDHDKLMICFMD